MCSQCSRKTNDHQNMGFNPQYSDHKTLFSNSSYKQFLSIAESIKIGRTNFLLKSLPQMKYYKKPKKA